MERKIFSLLAAVCICLAGCSSTPKQSSADVGNNHSNYHELMIKNYDEMSALVQSHLRAYHALEEKADQDPMAEAQAKNELKQALRLILSRPDSDNMVAKLVPEVRAEIAGSQTYTTLLSELATEAIQTLDPDGGVPVSVQATNLFLLDNLMSQIRPEIDDPSMKVILQHISDAHIQISPAVIREREMTAMFQTDNPSKVAKRVLQLSRKKKSH